VDQTGAVVSAGGASLYEVGVRVKELIRGRAVLLVLNRTDIVDAIDAEGVVLAPKGKHAPGLMQAFPTVKRGVGVVGKVLGFTDILDAIEG